MRPCTSHSVRWPMGPGSHRTVSKRPHHWHRPSGMADSTGGWPSWSKKRSIRTMHASPQYQASKMLPSDRAPQPRCRTRMHEETSHCSSSSPGTSSRPHTMQNSREEGPSRAGWGVNVARAGSSLGLACLLLLRVAKGREGEATSKNMDREKLSMEKKRPAQNAQGGPREPTCSPAGGRPRGRPRGRPPPRPRRPRPRRRPPPPRPPPRAWTPSRRSWAGTCAGRRK